MRYDQNRLFSRDSLEDMLRANADVAAHKVDNIPQDQFLASSDADILAWLVSEHTVEPLTLLEDHMRMSAPQETRVDVSGDRDRFFWPREGPKQPFFIPGTAIDVMIPYVGDHGLWFLRTNPFRDTHLKAQVSPRTEISPGILTISLVNTHDTKPERIKQALESTLEQIRWFINMGRPQVERAMQNLPKRVQVAIAARRERLGKHAGLVSVLNIPLAERPGAPSVAPIKVQPRITVPLPPPRTSFKPEPGIAPEMYEKILTMLRHTCRTYERTPQVYFQHPEEELRDMLLAHLNGHFQGAANGEVFRRSGKTDITIEEESRAAFVAECKIWEGAKKLDAAVNQLLAYLTWRDCKAAIVLFNKSVKGFSQLLDVVPKRLRAHPNFVSAASQSEQGEWGVIMRSAEDEARRVTVQVMLYNIYVGQN